MSFLLCNLLVHGDVRCAQLSVLLMSLGRHRLLIETFSSAGGLPLLVGSFVNQSLLMESY
jgi:hypothetical protein